MIQIAGGAAAGLFVGFLVGFVLAKRGAGALRGELSRAEDKLEALKGDFKSKLGKETARADKAEEELKGAKAELKTTKDSAAGANKELAKIQNAHKEVQGTVAKANEVAEAHKKARQQAEGRCKQAEALAQQYQQQVQSLTGQAQQFEQQAKQLATSSERQQKELQRLRAEMSSARPGSSSGLDESVDLFAEADGNLQQILDLLLANQELHAAVLSDANGIVVAASGDRGVRDGVAAVTQLVGSLTKQLDGMVPFHFLKAFELHDESSSVLSGRNFKCAGEMVGLATLGARAPSSRVLDGAQASLKSVLE